jgi:pSer/pThr/pTyr-binding forkhead associated (FHA) protein
MCTAPLPEFPEAPAVVGNATIMVQSPFANKNRSGALRLEKSGEQTQTLVLPRGEAIRIFVVAGARPGMEFELSRPLMTIGRLGGGADIQVDDCEVSRLHCSVEVRRDAILLQDLRSKNGTFIDHSRIFSARLEPTSQFKVGRTVLRIDRHTL